MTSSGLAAVERIDGKQARFVPYPLGRDLGKPLNQWENITSPRNKSRYPPLRETVFKNKPYNSLPVL